MKIYTFRGKDSNSDRGFYEVTVIEDSLLIAGLHLRAHLKEKGREDLKPICTAMHPLPERGILFSNVESLHEPDPKIHHPGPDQLNLEGDAKGS